MKVLCVFLFIRMVTPAPAGSFVFPDQRQERKLEPITPPVLPVLEHLERDPSTLLPGERGVSPKFGGGFDVRPEKGGFSGSVSSSLSGAGASHSASQSFSFGFNEGFSSSASQAASFNGFGGGFSGSQASSQAASFGSSSVSAAGSSAASQGGFGSQSASSAFGFSGNSFGPQASFGDGLLDVRHRGVPGFPFGTGRRGVAAAAFTRPRTSRLGDDFLSIIIS